MKNELYTIGYAPFSIKGFIDTLRQYDINAVVDVRSAPYSKFRPEFKKDNLNKFLSDNSISYIFLGKYVGARVEDSSCYVDGILNYSLLKDSENFRTGISRILEGMKNYRIALMCAEKDPVNCHRTFLICRTLRSYPVSIHHILDDGSLEEHSVTEKRIVQEYGLEQPDMFRSEGDRLEEAYDRMCERIELDL